MGVITNITQNQLPLWVHVVHKATVTTLLNTLIRFSFSCWLPFCPVMCCLIFRPSASASFCHSQLESWGPNKSQGHWENVQYAICQTSLGPFLSLIIELCVTLAAHQRSLWINPFCAGNGKAQKNTNEYMAPPSYLVIIAMTLSGLFAWVVLNR